MNKIDVRKEFLKFFEERGHKIYNSMSLVPNDASLLFTNAGMVQFKDIFTGKIPTPINKRATSCQLCVRAGGKHNDLENVGYTARHHTLFEMLGNFSFGDYFKEEAIAFAWEFVTENLKLPIDKLWVTIHNDDDEAYEIWQKHISKERIKRFGDKDNFWQMGDTGPCGPCSEIFIDQGEEHFNSEEDYLGGDGDRFLEIWNLVFMQYERDIDGTLRPLPKPSIDTGMGLERVQAIIEGKFNNFDSSLFTPIIEKIEELRGKKATEKDIHSYRVVADHLRSVSFMLSDGVMFDKEGRGYVLRRILRRAVRHGFLLGFRKPFITNLVDTLVDIMGEHYRDLIEKRSYIKEQILLEEERFFKTIESGMELFNRELQKTDKIFSGEVAFKLYDTYGFPLDLTQDMLKELNLKVDIEKFNTLMDQQRERAKANWKGSGDEIKEGDFKDILLKIGKNEFVGYHLTSLETEILTLLDNNFKEVEKLNEGENGYVMLHSTPFYATSGGQEGDRGYIKSKNSYGVVTGTDKYFGINLSKIEVKGGSFSKKMVVKTVVENRREVAKHHSATHLLQSALKEVLGRNVSQAGSLNNDKRLRFDFTYPKAMRREEIERVEKIVNSYIAQAIPGKVEEMELEKAKEMGAIAMFGEKYSDVVRVVSFGDKSIELCGGTHIKNTSEIGSFYIVKESGVSSGVRRIEAVCGLSAIKYAKGFIDSFKELQQEIKNQDPILGVKKLKEEIKELKEEIKRVQNSNRKELSIRDIKGIKVIIDEIEIGDIKSIIDENKNRYENIAIMLFQKKGDKLIIASGVKGNSIKAGEWLREVAKVVNGKGGGRADFAQGGGKDISKLNEAKERALEFIKKKL